MKKVLVTFIIMCLMVSIIAPFNVAAAGEVTVSGGTFEVGQTFETSINISHSDPIVAASLNIQYNSSVLSLISVSGAQYTAGNSSIDIADDAFTTAEKEVRSGSYKLKFKAIAAGNSDLSVSAKISVTTREKSTPSAFAAVTVVAPKPSSNANLASIKLSNGSLSPAFNPNTTKYTATVKYSVESINISGSVADGKSTYTGGGTFNLQVGENERVLTVTAEDGTKKSYTIKIKRMTEQETADAEQAARDANPLLVIINNADYSIVNSFDGITIPSGFTQGTITRKESEIAVLNDESGKYQLCWLVDANGENGAFYHRDENDNFTKLAYVNANGIMYIIENLNDDIVLPSGFVRRPYVNGDQNSDAIKYVNEALEDFYIFNCFVPGQAENAFYRYDALEGTMQRATDFDAAVKTASEQALEEQQNPQETSWFGAMSKTGRIVFLIFIVVAVLFVVVAVLLVVKISASREEENDDEYVSAENDEFVIPFAEEDDNGEEATIDDNTDEDQTSSSEQQGEDDTSEE